MDTRTLAATGWTVPANPAYFATRLKQMRTRNGVAFTATLRVPTGAIGEIENQGDGGATTLYADRVIDREAWKNYVDEWITMRGYDADRVSYASEELLGILVDEADLNRRFTAALKRGQRVVRDPVVDPETWQTDGYPVFIVPDTEETRAIDLERGHEVWSPEGWTAVS
jgi:hypothetical protein